MTIIENNRVELGIVDVRKRAQFREGITMHAAATNIDPGFVVVVTEPIFEKRWSDRHLRLLALGCGRYCCPRVARSNCPHCPSAAPASCARSSPPCKLIMR